jgi:hypothetical protein
VAVAQFQVVPSSTNHKTRARRAVGRWMLADVSFLRVAFTQQQLHTSILSREHLRLGIVTLIPWPTTVFWR